MKINELAQYIEINSTDNLKVRSIADEMIDGTFVSPAILVHSVHRMAITGSHRIAAARLVMDYDWENDTEHADNEVHVIEVDEYIDSWCEAEGCSIDDVPWRHLRLIFAGTNLEDEVSQNDEW